MPPRSKRRATTTNTRATTQRNKTQTANTQAVATAGEDSNGSRGIRRSTRAHPSRVQDNLPVKKKPEYVFVSVNEDEGSSSDIFDLPPRRVGSRVGVASRVPTALESVSDHRSTPADARQVTLKEAALPTRPRPRPREKKAQTLQETDEYEPANAARRATALARSLAPEEVTSQLEDVVSTPDLGVQDSNNIAGAAVDPITVAAIPTVSTMGPAPTGVNISADRGSTGSSDAPHSDTVPETGNDDVGSSTPSIPPVLPTSAGSQPVSNPSGSASGDSSSSSTTLRSTPPSATTAAASRPSTSAPPTIESLQPGSRDSDSSGDEGSDYSEHVARERQTRINRAGHQNVDYSDQEDEAEDLLLEDDVVPESDGVGGSNRRKHKKKSKNSKTRKHHRGHKQSNDKGKSKAIASDDCLDSADATIPSEDSKTKKNKPGPLPKEAKEEIARAGAAFRAQLLEYSIKYGKDFSEISFTAGWSLKSSRADNEWNLFSRWYARKNDPADDNEWDMLEWNRKMKDAYWDLFADVDRNDHAARKKIMEPIIQELALLELDDQEAMKMRSAVSRANAYHNLQDLHVGGFIIYTGHDPSARMHSAFFTGSDAMAELATHNEVAYAKVLDCLETGIKAAILNKHSGLNIPIPKFGETVTPPLGSRTRMKTTKRDLYRALVSAMLREILNEHLPPGKQFKDFPWALWPEKAYDLKLCLLNWPQSADPPGANFKYKELSQRQLEVLLGPARTKAALRQWEAEAEDGADTDNEDNGTESDGVTRRDGAPRLFKDIQIVKWTPDQRALSSEDRRFGEIPLVVSRDGRPLRVVSDTKAWMREQQRGRNSRKRHRSPSPAPSPAEDSERTRPVETINRQQTREPAPKRYRNDYVHGQASDEGTSSGVAYHGREFHEQYPGPVAGPSRGDHWSSLAHVRGQAQLPSNDQRDISVDLSMCKDDSSDIDARIASMKAKLQAAKERSRSAKEAELRRLEEALRAAEGDDDLFAFQ